ncbi:MAG: thioredoxin family protein [Candidatus Viridilinea halotolerans]|uniref:Thioredoxin family protein n=1 Tax=Candidatus Viridilinea halotolerans TaxID=2491704 RepID=A0A426U7V7_9CHLR|nr:MAG: thioredoxin family protein [Candidatus Viridilinea halotolerans]
MNVKVLGSGCSNCKRLEERVRKVMRERGLEGEVEKVTDYAEMMRWNILKTPGLVVDDVLVASGRIPNDDELAGWLVK